VPYVASALMGANSGAEQAVVWLDPPSFYHQKRVAVHSLLIIR